MNNIALNSLSTIRAASGVQSPGPARTTASTEVDLKTEAENAESKTVEAPPTIPAEASAEELEGAVEQLNGFMQSIKRELHFSIDDESGRTVIKVIDSETQEIIRQIPPEQVERFVQNLGTGPGGLMPAVRA